MDTVEHLLAEYKHKDKEYSETTKNDFRRAFNRFSELFSTSDFKTLFTEHYDNVVKVLCQNFKSHMYWHKVNIYCKFYGIPCKEIPLSTNDSSKIPVHDISKIRTKISKIRDLKAKVFLTLLANTIEYCVRRDWAIVMIREHCTQPELDSAKALYTMATGEFEFIELNKTGRSMKFVIEPTTQELLKEYISELDDKKYLYNYNTKEEPTDTKRTNSFSHYLTRMTEKHLGKKMSVNDFRKAMEMESVGKVRDSTEPNALHKYIESVSKRDHCATTAIKYYVNDTDTVPNPSTEPLSVPVACTDSTSPVSPVLPVSTHKDVIDMILTLVKLGKDTDEIDKLLSVFYKHTNL